MKTVLLSTTCLWNCGDDFIREGILELLQFKPNVRILWWNRGYGIKNAYANSLKINLPLIDYFIVAGTPEWFYRNEYIYKYCLKKGIPFSIIGVGTRNVFGRMHHNLMKQIAKSGLCDVVLCRDKRAAHVFNEFKFQNINTMLDPAFFMKPLVSDKKIHILNWRSYFIAWGPTFPFKYPHRWLYRQFKTNVLKRNFWTLLRENYNKVMKEIFTAMPEPKEITVHDNFEVQKAQDLFQTENVFYSTNYREIFKRYASARVYIGSRIHGTIPSIIHGASAYVLYATPKAEALEVSLEILYKYIPNLFQVIKIKYLNDKDLQISHRELPKENPIDQKIIAEAINKEKLRIREILKNQPRLSTFLL